MHKAQRYFDTYINTSGGPPQGIALNPAIANTLTLELAEDAKSYLYSAIVSVGDAVHAIQRDMFSWSTVKLYYAVFYALRATLAAHGFAILYYSTGQKSTPYRLKASPGEAPLKLSGNTHKVVLQQYALMFPSSHLVTQKIALENPFDWMINRREEANYKNSRFYEPATPDFFQKIVASKLRSSLSTYINDQGKNFAFDKDHAILALPIAAIQTASQAFKSRNPAINLAKDDISYLSSLFRDSHGEINDAKILVS